MRGTLALSEFNVTFKYKEGKSNTAADCLSRMASHATNGVDGPAVLYGPCK